MSTSALFENPLFRIYCFYGSILLLKTVLMSIITSSARIANKAFTNPEDAEAKNVKPQISENVERVRRAHLNDLENIPTFLIISLIYICTNPSVTITHYLFIAFTVCRILHSIIYVKLGIQPARGLVWLIAYIISIYMAIASILHFAH